MSASAQLRRLGRGPVWGVIFAVWSITGMSQLLRGVARGDVFGILSGFSLFFTALGAFALNRSTED